MPTVYQQLIAAGRSESGQALVEALGDCPLNVTPAQYAEADRELGLGRQSAATNGWAVSYWLLKNGAYARAASGDFAGAIAIAAGLWPACRNPEAVVPPSGGIVFSATIPPQGGTTNLFNDSTLWIVGIGLVGILLIKRWSDA